MEAYLINPISRSARRGGSRRKKMAKRKLHGAALAAHMKKVRRGGRKVRKARKSVRVVSRKARRVRRRHVVKAHVVHAHKSSWRRRKHMSNPFRIPTMGGMMSGAQTAVLGIGTLFGALWLSGFIERNVSRFVPAQMQGRIGGLIVKLGSAFVAYQGIRYFVKRDDLRKAALYGVALPIVADGAMMVVPGLAAQVPMIAAASSGAYLPMGAPSAPAQVAAELNRELEAELEEETEDSLF